MVEYPQFTMNTSSLWSVDSNQSIQKDERKFGYTENRDLIMLHNQLWADDQIQPNSIFTRNHKVSIVGFTIPKISDDIDIEIW